MGHDHAARLRSDRVYMCGALVANESDLYHPASMGPLISLAFLVAAADPGVSFPGQWAPPAANQKYPSPSPKVCWTRFADPAERATCLETVVKDFGRLERFHAANLALGPLGKGERRIVFFGDSITDNWSKPNYGGFFPGKRYVNRGIGGQTTGQMLLRFRPDVIALAPRAVVILAGTNDLSGNTGPVSPDTIESNLTTMVELARAHKINVALASLLPVCDCKKSPDGKPITRTQDRPPQSIVALNQRIAALARKTGVAYIDYFSALVDTKGALKTELTDDGLHPNAAGYAVMAPLVEKVIAKLAR
jgi:lysophospholipase L1-like esterase